MKIRPRKKTHGGKRKGAGAKPTLINPTTPKVYIDSETREFMETLGAGNLSAGIRKARILLEENQIIA